MSAHVDASERFSTGGGGVWDSLSAAVEVWPLQVSPSLPGQIYPSLSGQIYSQYGLPVSLLLSSTDEPGRSQTDAPGGLECDREWGRGARRGREKE